MALQLTKETKSKVSGDLHKVTRIGQINFKQKICIAYVGHWKDKATYDAGDPFIEEPVVKLGADDLNWTALEALIETGLKARPEFEGATDA